MILFEEFVQVKHPAARKTLTILPLHLFSLLTINMSTFHLVPQKLPTFEVKSSGPCIATHGLSKKHCSPGQHSSPRGHGRLVAQF